VSSDDHLAQLDKIAVVLIVDLNHTPRITTTADMSTLGIGDLSIRSDNSKRNFRHDLIVLRNSFLVIKLVTWAFENADAVVSEVVENLELLEVAR